MRPPRKGGVSRESGNGRTGHKSYYVVMHSISWTFLRCCIIYVWFICRIFFWRHSYYAALKTGNKEHFHAGKQITKKPSAWAQGVTTRSWKSVCLWIHCFAVTLGPRSGVCTWYNLTLRMASMVYLSVCTHFDHGKCWGFFWGIYCVLVLDMRKKICRRIIYINKYYIEHMSYIMNIM